MASGSIQCVTDDDLKAYAGREWAQVEESKRRYWAKRKTILSPAEALEVAEGLRRHVRAMRPDWPSPAERATDLEVHARVSASLRRVR
jgi:hypothetical protein